MTDQKLITSWIWLDEDETRGLRMDVENGLLCWYDQIGCHCTDEDYLLQTVQEFRQDGCPPWIGDLPVDVDAELAQALALTEPR